MRRVGFSSTPGFFSNPAIELASDSRFVSGRGSYLSDNTGVVAANRFVSNVFLYVSVNVKDCGKNWREGGMALGFVPGLARSSSAVIAGNFLRESSTFMAPERAADAQITDEAQKIVAFRGPR